MQHRSASLFVYSSRSWGLYFGHPPDEWLDCIPSSPCPQGLAVYGSGTQSPPLQRGQRQLTPAQVNNVFSFPGMGKGCVASGVPGVSTGMLLAAARTIAELVSDGELGAESILPAIPRLREVAEAVADSE